jgi:ribulose-phosphate 3-epimerase
MLTEVLPYTDLVLVMLVNPGFGGQEIIPECLEKVRFLAAERQRRGFNYQISVDGGINAETAAAAAAAGADILVAGSAFFNAPDKAAFVQLLHGLRG